MANIIVSAGRKIIKVQQSVRFHLVGNEGERIYEKVTLNLGLEIHTVFRGSGHGWCNPGKRHRNRWEWEYMRRAILTGWRSVHRQPVLKSLMLGFAAHSKSQWPNKLNFISCSYHSSKNCFAETMIYNESILIRYSLPGSLQRVQLSYNGRDENKKSINDKVLDIRPARTVCHF